MHNPGPRRDRGGRTLFFWMGDPRMHYLRLSTFLTPARLAPALLAVSAAPALAATTVSTATTTPLVTATAGDVTVASGGTITVPGGPAITVDSANSVTVANGGTLTVSPSSNSGGVLVNSGIASTIANAGTISVTENYTVAVVTGTSTPSGPIANTTGRYGIAVGAGGSGSLSNTGTIYVKGLNSAGILTSGTYTGNITNTGSIAIKGDGSIGISIQNLTGNLVAGGSIGVVGAGSQALVVAGDVTGSFSIQGSMAQVATYSTDTNTSQTLSAAMVNAGKAVVEVNGNVTGGIQLFALCSPTTVGSVASCTSTGTTGGTGSITALGNNPALQIGGANAITIGGNAASIDGQTYSLAVDGSITATGTYAGTSAFGVVVGGRGGAVTMTKGIGVTGTISVTALDATATAVLVSAGSTSATLTNSGTIKAALTQSGGTAAYGVRDLSGTLATVTNHGLISASGAPTAVAIDLSANTSGATVTQSLSAFQAAQQTAEQANAGYTYAGRVIYTGIVGDIRTGSGNDTIAIQSGTVAGNAFLGGGTDQVQLSGDGTWVGDLNFGTGSATIGMAGTSAFVGGLALGDQPATLTIGGTAAFRGSAITGGSQLAVTVNGGSFGASRETTLTVGSLNVGAGGTISAFIDGTTGTSALIEAATASFASGAKVSARVSSLASAAGTYKILSAGTLTGTPTFDATTLALPVLFKGSIAVTGNELFLTLGRKTATELGLTSAQAEGYDAIYANASLNSALSASLLQVGSVGALQGQFNTLLPDHAGGVFDFVTRGSRLAARHVADDSAMYNISDVAGWVEPIYFKATKHATGTAGWDTDGGGLSAGMEKKTGIGNVGVSLAWFTGKIHNGSWQTVKATNFELGAFWRISQGPLYAFARLSASRVALKSIRTFSGAADGALLNYTANGRWNGWAMSGSAGASYKLALPGNFSLKPMGILEYYRLHENGYGETGSTVIDLTVNSRTSKTMTAITTLTAGWSAGRSDHDNRPLTIELEGGRRNQLSGVLGATTAKFGGGNPFTITPDDLKGGWLGEARVVLGGFDYTWQIAARAEQRTGGGVNKSLRASLSMAF